MTFKAKIWGTAALGALATGLGYGLVRAWGEVHPLQSLGPFPRLPPPRADDPNLAPDESPGLLDVDSEADDEPEPAGIVYDTDEPCHVPPAPWELPVAMPGKVSASEGAGCVPPADLEPLQKTELPFAEGGERPVWPVPKDKKMRVSYEDVRGLYHGKFGRDFGASRKSTDQKTGDIYHRVHVGLDLFANDGDPVVAMEDGTVLATLPYYKGLGALYVLNDSGIIVNYGEIAMNSWRKHGIKTGIETGQRITAGQTIANVGVSNDGSHMLHVETFAPETTVDQIRQGEMRWIKGDPAPEGVLDPTRYLVRARQAAIEDMA
jgi:hypothetical protein